LTTSLPNIAAVIGPVLQRIPADVRPLVIAAAERSAAKRYRDWANQVADPAMQISLRACADREDEVARLIEALFPNAEAKQKELLLQTPELTDSGNSLFAPFTLQQQFTLQAQGERIGADTWRSYAQRSEPSVRDVFLTCARLEEESAEYLESIVDRI
jgi:hypothetical protein